MWPSFVSLPLVSLCFWPELGTRHHCCDNVTLLSGHKIVGYCIVCISVVDTPFITKDLNNFHMFACHWSCFTWLHCRCPEAKQLSRAQLTVLTLHCIQQLVIYQAPGVGCQNTIRQQWGFGCQKMEEWKHLLLWLRGHVHRGAWHLHEVRIKNIIFN